MNPVFEIAFVWAAIGAYAASSVAFTIGTIFGKPNTETLALRLAWLGLILHGLAIASRWVRVGHGPYLGFYEVSSLLALMTVAGFLLVVRRYPGVKIAGVAVMPISFLILGASLLVNTEAQAVTGSLASFWLVIHVIFANLAFGAYAVSFALAVAFLLKDSGAGRKYQVLLDKFPEQDILDALTYRFVGAGFVFQTVMIASGSIWANEAWGRYWGWDPVETWSLIAWAIYAIYLHLTLTLGWRERKAAWIAVIALPVILFSLLGVPIAYNSIHGAYLSL
ncbi:MAG: c-type cytochrome biogenesis protein CcsB [Actinobacteria bacterium]|nr:c-type cytochrome biogenesis protein CcsB [Actinomycetota bacterium]MCG2807935.1 c-type cytochrome biogenesis protein CcsB [Coriobacteriia bacterium]